MEPRRASSLSSGAAFLVGAVLLVVSTTIRLVSYPTITSDYTYFLAKWFDALHAHAGLSAFQYPFSDYAPLYLYLLKLLTYLPVYSLWSIKTLSLAFDIGVAYLAYRLLKDTKHYSQGVLFLCASIMLSVPTVVLNSSLWGQSDALYALGIVGALYMMLADKPRWVALWFALAFAFKFQAVFFLPVLAGYFLPRRAAWLELLWIPAVYVACVLPAWLGGAPFLSELTIYAHQSGEYTSLNVSSPSVFAFADGLPLSQSMQHVLFWAGIGIAAAAAAAVVFVVSRLPARASVYLYWSLVCVIAVPYFLPRMHERYFYVADVLSVLYALYTPRRWYVPVLVAGSSLLAYMPFLSGQVPFFSGVHVDLRFPSAMLLAALVVLLVQLVPLMRRRFAASRAPREMGPRGAGAGEYALSLGDNHHA
jgi:Gpi18-like mannosyltransferase